jgi:murein tripeptide amidase MpaA
MNRWRWAAVIVSLGAPVIADAQAGPRTQAERTNYTETSSHASVQAFIDTLRMKLGLAISGGVMGKTTEGRDLPYVVVSRPLFATPEAARRSGRPIVFVQGNIHSGEVEGKEALQALVRDLLLDPKRNVLDSIVLIALPNYNADGNERLAPQARNRGAQNGPEMVGTRPNATRRTRRKRGRRWRCSTPGIRTYSSTCTRPMGAITATT